MRLGLIFLSLFLSFQIAANPFAIDFPCKENVSNEDYIEIQKQLRAIDINPLLRELHTPHQHFISTYEDFFYRCSRGIRRILINPEKGQFPTKHLQKIGKGSDMCIVCCAPFDQIRSKFIESIPSTLEKVGFNGYFYYRIGGFPNPTGREIQYVGVPYCFKIFMMLEAEKLGFNKVLWIDSACLPLTDPAPIFEWIDATGIFIMPNTANGYYLLPATRNLLRELSGTDVLQSMHLFTAVFGLKMNDAQTIDLVQDYYSYVELGSPFLSCFPEEFVLNALIKKHFGSLATHNLSVLKFPETEENFELYKNQGFYFYLRSH